MDGIQATAEFAKSVVKLGGHRKTIEIVARIEHPVFDLDVGTTGIW